MSDIRKFIVCLALTVTLGQELLQNPDFENENSLSPWICNECNASIIPDNYHGKSSVRVSVRFVLS